MKIKPRFISIFILLFMISSLAYSQDNSSEHSSWYICGIKSTGKADIEKIYSGPHPDRMTALANWIYRGYKDNDKYCIAENLDFVTAMPSAYYTPDYKSLTTMMENEREYFISRYNIVTDKKIENAYKKAQKKLGKKTTTEAKGLWYICEIKSQGTANKDKAKGPYTNIDTALANWIYNDYAENLNHCIAVDYDYQTSKPSITYAANYTALKNEFQNDRQNFITKYKIETDSKIETAYNKKIESNSKTAQETKTTQTASATAAKTEEKITATEDASGNWYICEIQSTGKASQKRYFGPYPDKETALANWIYKDYADGVKYCIAEDFKFITAKPRAYYKPECDSLKDFYENDHDGFIAKYNIETDKKIEKAYQKKLAAAAKKNAKDKATAEQQAKEEAEKLIAEQKAKEEAERLVAEQKAREEAEALAEAQRLEEEQKAKEEAERLAAEQKAREEAEALAEAQRLEEEQKAKEEAERLAAEQKAREEAEALAEAQRLEEEQKAKEEAERLAAEQKAREEAEALAEAQRLEEEQKAKEEAERLAAEQKAREEAEALAEAQRLEEEQKAKEEAERLAAEQKAREEAEALAEAQRLEEEQKAKEEAEKLAAEQKAREEAEALAEAQRLEEEQKAKEEAERLAAEQKAREEAEALAEAQRLKTEQKLLEAENKVRELEERLSLEQKAHENTEAQRLEVEQKLLDAEDKLSLEQKAREDAVALAEAQKLESEQKIQEAQEKLANEQKAREEAEALAEAQKLEAEQKLQESTDEIAESQRIENEQKVQEAEEKLTLAQQAREEAEKLAETQRIESEQKIQEAEDKIRELTEKLEAEQKAREEAEALAEAQKTENQPFVFESTGTSVSRYKKEYLQDYVPSETVKTTDSEKSTALKIENPDKTDQKGRTLLMNAAKTGNEWQIKALINSGADISKADNDGWTALMYACRYQESLSTVKSLVESGADVKQKTTYGATALTMAATYNNNPEILNYLLEFYDASEKEIYKAFVLLLSSKQQSEYINVTKVENFLKKGISLNTFYQGKTPLMYAAKYGNSTAILKLLMDHDALTSVRSTEGKTAFEYAVENTNLSHDENYWALNNK